MTFDRVFLTAEWRNLVMLNYEVDPSLLLPYVPAGTTLDQWNGKTYASLVGFQFLRTRVMGLPIPFHSNFEEINLRFYVRRVEGDEVRRGVVFIREIVPRRAIAWIARSVYNENYLALPMSHEVSRSDRALAVTYRWKSLNKWSEISLDVEGEPTLPLDGSHAQFITEHYWGYAAQKNRGCVEYRVTHPSWKVWHARQAHFEGNVEELYGENFAVVLRGAPASAFLAEGSAVTVMRGRRI